MNRPSLRSVAAAAAMSLALHAGLVHAVPVTAPTGILWSATPSDLVVTYTSLRDPRDSSIFNGEYLARDVTPGGSVQAPWAGLQVFTPATITQTAGAVGAATSAQVDVYGNAGDFDARVRAAVTSDAGLDAFAGGRAGVGHWYVVNGTGSTPVSLRVDLLFQGQLYAAPCADPSCSASASFTNILGLVASPDALVQTTPLLINGAVTNEASPPFGSQGTVPDIVFAADGTVHDINLIVRSNPFLVTPNVPFRLNLSLNASAGAFGPGPSRSWIDFYDPTLATSGSLSTAGLSPTGFLIDLDGLADTRDVRPLEVSGLRDANVPTPGTFALLGVGLAGVGLVGRGRR